MNYKKETDRILEQVFKRKLMTDEEWKEFLKSLLSFHPDLYDQFEKSLIEGERLGYTIENQTEILKTLWSQK